MLDDRARLDRAPNAYSTRRVPRAQMVGLLRGSHAPQPGDLVLARLEYFGQHKKLHLPNGRRRTLFLGDEFIVAYANRYAPRQFEAHVPPDLRPCHLVAAGGVASHAITWHDKVRGPTEITPIGLVAGPDGKVVNTAHYAIESVPPIPSSSQPRVIAFAGTAMNSGKTTCAARLALGLSRSGLRVGYGKVTGTGAAGDPFLLEDSGASPVVDFTDFGHVSTYLVEMPVVERLLVDMVRHLERAGCDVILLELADGLLQRETQELLASDCLRNLCDGIVFAAGDAMGAAGGVDLIKKAGHRVLAASGVLTAAPLQTREANSCISVPVLGLDDLSDPATARKLVMSVARDAHSVEPIEPKESGSERDVF